MLPTLHLGPLEVSTYYLAYLVAIPLAGTLSFRRLLRAGVPLRFVLEGLTLTILAGLGGAVLFWGALRLVYTALLHGSETIPARGSTIFGAFLIGGIVGILYIRARSGPVGQVFDIGIVPIPLGQAIGRLGCFLGGCCYGSVTGSWLGMELPGAHGVWAARYPAQLLSGAADLIIWGALLAVERRCARRSAPADPLPFGGFLTLLGLQLYFAKRFAIEFLREERPLVLPPLTWAHALSALGFLVAFAVMVGGLRAASRQRAAGARA